MKKSIISILVTFLFFACGNNEEKSDAFGNFEADPVIVSAESSGKILELNIEKGQQIEQGAMAAVIDTMQVSLKLKQIEAQKAAVTANRQSIRTQIEVFEEQIKNLRINQKRVENMLKDGAATQKQLDDINGQISVLERQIENTQTKYTAVNKELEVLDAQQAASRDMLERCIVTAPSGGTILETYVERGELAAPGKPLFKLANLDVLTLKVYVSGAQLPKVKIGEEVNVLIDETKTENQELKGRITWISPEAEFTPKIIQTKEERVKLVYAVKVAVQNDGTLKIGMPGEIRFQ